MSYNQALYPNFKWTFSTLGCPELTLDQCCDLAESYGSLSIEARTLEKTAELPNLFEANYGSPDKLADAMNRRSASIDFLDTSLKLFSNDDTSRGEFLEFVPWAEALGVKWLRVFDGGTVAESLEDDAIDGALETLSWWNELKAENRWHVDMAIETHDSLVFENARQQLLEKAVSPIRFIWDTHHTWKKAGEDVAQTWSLLKDLIVNVHIKDSVSIASARHPFTYTQLGEGEFPLESTLEMLKRDGYRGNVSIEWERQWHPYLPPLETALAKARALAWI